MILNPLKNFAERAALIGGRHLRCYHKDNRTERKLSMKQCPHIIARWLDQGFIILFGRPDSLLTGYYALLLLHAVLAVAPSVKRHVRPRLDQLLRAASAACLYIAMANIIANALHLPSLRFLTLTYYLLSEAKAILAISEQSKHKPPPQLRRLIKRRIRIKDIKK